MPSGLMAGVLRAIGVVFGVVTLTFVLLHLAPGDPAQRLLGPAATPAQLAAARHTLGLDRPLPAQYAEWISRAARGDFGTSISTGRQVGSLLAQAWPATAILVTLSLALTYLIGITVGAIQANTRHPAIDETLTVATVSLFAMPAYWLGLVLIMVFTYELRWLPAFGARGVDAEFLPAGAQWIDRIRHAALPLATLTLIGIGGTARFVRSSMRTVRDAPFLTAARSKGVTRRRVVFRHQLRNALVPVITLLGLSLPALFSGTVFVEAIFAWPGVGQLLVQGVQARDYPVVMASATMTAILVVMGNVFADALLEWLDPRARRSAARV